jgi:hypothetical protein
MVSRPLVADAVTVAPVWVSRDDCPTCQLQRDDVGRLPIGFCGPDCIARKARDERLGRA